MDIFSWLDQRTLVASQLPVAAAFALVLLGMRKVNTNPRGTNAIAVAYFLWIPATILFLTQGSAPAFASVILANVLAILCYLFMYRGTLSFFQAKGAVPLLYDVAAVAAAIVIYFTSIYDLSVPRIVAMSVFIALARGLIAIELYRHANKRQWMLAGAGFLSFFALLPLCVAISAIWPNSIASAPAPRLHLVLESFSTLVDLGFLCVTGLFAFTTFLEEIKLTVKKEGQVDAVTGTLNRHAIEDALASEVARSSRTHSPVSVMLVEIDHFKSILDTYGHDRGDQTLCTVVQTIASILRFYDKCGRLTDDKFLVLLPENMAEHAMVIASRFRDALKDPKLPADQPAITLSIGVTQCAFKEPAIEVLARAELALLEARRKGRNGAYLKLPNHEDIVIPHPDRVANRSRVAKLIR